MRRTRGLNNYVLLSLIFAVLSGLSSVLSGCGDSGEGSIVGPGTGTSSNPPIILAELHSYPTGAVPPGFGPPELNSKVFVEIRNPLDQASITTASVIVNGVSISYNDTDKLYEGLLNVSTGETVNLEVSIDGRSYSASTTQFNSYPIFTSPSTTAIWSSGRDQTVTWSGGSPTVNAVYNIAVIDANDPNDTIVWPAGDLFKYEPIINSWDIIPANSLTTGKRLAIVLIAKETYISNAAGSSSFIIAGFNYVPITVIAGPPANVSATPSDGKTTINWDTVNGATSYDLYWSTSAANATKLSGAKIAGVTSPYNHTGLSNGTTYYYAVTATTTDGESEVSSPVVSSIPGAIHAPLNAIAAPSNGNATIRWPPVAGANSYNIYWSTSAANANKSSGTKIAVNYSSAVPYYVHQGLTNGTPYYYVVTAVSNYYGESEVSSPVASAVPGSNVTATFGSGQVSIAWTAVPGALSYNLYWSTTAADATMASGNKITGVTVPHVLTGLSDGTPYYYLVTAVTANGESALFPPIAGVPGAYLMGGAMQGYAINPSNTVTSLPGVAEMSSLRGITTDGTSLFVVDTFYCRIQTITIATGAVKTLAGAQNACETADGIGSSARFYYPQGITTDGTYVYVVDSMHTIRKVEIATGAVTTIAGLAGSPGSTDGTGSNARFNFPYPGGSTSGITTDGVNLYVAETVNSVIRKIVISSGVVTTLAGVAGSAGWADGTGTEARFYAPVGITTDGTNLYVTDAAALVRKIEIGSAVVTTVAGSPQQYGSVDGTGSAARFSGPNDITTDGTNLYVADGSIRKIVISTRVVTTLADSSKFTYSALYITTDGIGLFVIDRAGVKKVR